MRIAEAYARATFLAVGVAVFAYCLHRRHYTEPPAPAPCAEDDDDAGTDSQTTPPTPCAAAEEDDDDVCLS